jgi:hypothetical protein
MIGRGLILGEFYAGSALSSSPLGPCLARARSFGQFRDPRSLHRTGRMSPAFVKTGGATQAGQQTKLSKSIISNTKDEKRNGHTPIVLFFKPVDIKTFCQLHLHRRISWARHTDGLSLRLYTRPNPLRTPRMFTTSPDKSPTTGRTKVPIYIIVS